MRILDRESLGGDLPLRDHRDDVDPHLRSVVFGTVVEGREDATGRYDTMGGPRTADAGKPQHADLQGALYVPPDPDGERKIGSLFFGAPVVLAEASPRPEEEASSSTRERAQAAKPRDVRVRLVRDKQWAEDDRYDPDYTASLHPDAPDLPKGALAILLQGTEERSHEPLLFPIGPQELRAVNRGPDPDLSSIVYDTTPANENDQLWKARLHKFWRVSRMGPLCTGDGTSDALAWQLVGPTRGLVVDRPSAEVRPPEKVAREEGAREAGGTTPAEGESNYGGVYRIEDLLRQQEERLAKAQNGEGPGGAVLGGVTILGGTRERTPGGGPSTTTKEPKPGEATTVRDLLKPPTPLDADLAYACMSAKVGGPIDVGSLGDPHRLGVTEDGCPINAAHLSTAALWRGGVGDGPLEFEDGPWVEPNRFARLSKVHLRWNPSATHVGPCGSHAGVWSWEAETHVYIPPIQPPPEPPPWIPDPPYDPGGIRVGGGGIPVPPVGGGPEPPPREWIPLAPALPYGGREIQTFPLPAPGVPMAECKQAPAGPGAPANAVGGAPQEGGGAVAVPVAGGAGGPVAGQLGGRDKQKSESKFADLERSLGLPLGTIQEDGSVVGTADQYVEWINDGIIGTDGKILVGPRVGDSSGQRLAVMGGRYTAIPTTVGSQRVSGAVLLRPLATQDGEPDVAVGGSLPSTSQALLDKAPDAAAFVAIATGSGAYDGFATDSVTDGYQPQASIGGVIPLPPRLATGQGLQEIVDGKWAPGGALNGTINPLTMFMPGGVNRLHFGTPSLSSGVSSGVSAEATADGSLTFQPKDADGAATGGALVLTSSALTYNGSNVLTSSSAAGNPAFGTGDDGPQTFSGTHAQAAPWEATTISVTGTVTAYGSDASVLRSTGATTWNSGTWDLDGHASWVTEDGQAGDGGGSNTDGGDAFGSYRTACLTHGGGSGGGGSGGEGGYLTNGGEGGDGTRGGPATSILSTGSNNGGLGGDSTTGTAVAGANAANYASDPDSESRARITGDGDVLAAFGGLLSIMDGGANGAGGAGGGGGGYGGGGYTGGSGGTITGPSGATAASASNGSAGQSSSADSVASGGGGGGSGGPGGGLGLGFWASVTYTGSNTWSAQGLAGGNGGVGGSATPPGADANAGGGGSPGGGGGGGLLLTLYGTKTGTRPTGSVGGGAAGTAGSGGTTTSGSNGAAGGASQPGENGYDLERKVAS